MGKQGTKSFARDFSTCARRIVGELATHCMVIPLISGFDLKWGVTGQLEFWIFWRV